MRVGQLAMRSHGRDSIAWPYSACASDALVRITSWGAIDPPGGCHLSTRMSVFLAGYTACPGNCAGPAATSSASRSERSGNHPRTVFDADELADP